MATEPERDPTAAASPRADVGHARWRVLEALIKKGDGNAVARILSQSDERPSAGEFAYWARLSLPDHPAVAHLLSDSALEADVALPAAHLAKAHACITTGDAPGARGHYDLARGIDPEIWDPALEKSMGASDEVDASAQAVETHLPASELEGDDYPDWEDEAELEDGSDSDPTSDHDLEAPGEFDPGTDADPQIEEDLQFEPEDTPSPDEGEETGDAPDNQTGADAAHQAVELEEWPEGDGDLEALPEGGEEEFAEPLPAEPLKPHWNLTAVVELAPLPPLVDPGAIPPIRPLSYRGSTGGGAVALKFDAQDAPNDHVHAPLIPGVKDAEEKHPTLPGEDPNFSPVEAEAEEVVLMVADPGEIPALPEKNDIKERVSATATTILVHAALFILLAVLIIAIPDTKPPEIIATTADITESDTIRRKVSRSVRGAPSPPSRSSLPLLAANATSNVVAPTVALDVPSETMNLGTSFGDGAAFGGGFGKGGSFGVPGAMKSRCSAEERRKMLVKHGGSAITERAIVRGLAWIAQQQNKDGSWGKKYKTAMTGLALLAFLGHCETPDSRRFGNRVMNGIMYLVEISKEKRIYASSSGHSAAYEHGIATYALGESYAIARLGKRPLPGMRDAFVKGTETIIKGQNPDGGWSYGYPKRGASDISVTGWQYQALKAANHTKIKIDGLDEAINKAQAFLAGVQDRNTGGFPYRPGQFAKRTLTSAGVLGLQMLGGSEKYAENIERGLRFALGDLHDQNWKNANMYTWYYNTQACFQYGGNPWQHWNKMFSNQLTTNQGLDGAWDGAGGNHAGSDAHFYSTCLAVLMLEVYYRYLPAAG